MSSLSRNRFRRLLPAVSLALASACASGGASTAAPVKDRVRLGFDLDGRPWKQVNKQSNGATSITEFVRPDESLASWREMLTMQTFERSDTASDNPANAQAALRARMLERCPAATWQALREDSASVLYEWRIASCAGQEDQHEVARIVDNAHVRMRLAYTYKGAMPDSVRASWVKRLGEANWEPAGK